jgi:hypothetical protein
VKVRVKVVKGRHKKKSPRTVKVEGVVKSKKKNGSALDPGLYTSAASLGEVSRDDESNGFQEVKATMLCTTIESADPFPGYRPLQ